MDSMDSIIKYFPDLTAEQIEKLSRLGELYADWNEKINVISRKDMDHFYERHVRVRCRGCDEGQTAGSRSHSAARVAK